MHVLFQIRPRIIIISFLGDKSPALGISFNEAHQTSECEFIQRRSFFFSLSVLCTAWLWNMCFFRIPNYVFALQRTNGNKLVFIVWKMIMCWLFGGLFLRTNHGHCLPLSADAYMVNREWDSLMTMSPSVDKEGWREMAFPLPLFLVTTIVS